MSGNNRISPADIIFNIPEKAGVVLSGHGLYGRHTSECLVPPVITSIPKSLGDRALSTLNLGTPASHNEYDNLNTDCQRIMAEFRNTGRERIRREASGPLADNDPMREKIASMYGEAANLIDALKYQRGIDRASKLGSYNKEASKVIGNIGEATIFALLARSMRGEDDDPYTVIPASTQQDSGNIDNNGLRHGYDLRVYRRHEGDSARIQIKISDKAANSLEYHPDILVISLESIAGGTDESFQLHDAIIQEVHNNPDTPYNTELIDAAAKRLDSAINQHIEQLSTYQ